MNHDAMSYCQLYSASQLVSSSGVSVQSKSRLEASYKDEVSLTLSFQAASKYSGKIYEFLMSGVNQDSFLKMISGFA